MALTKRHWILVGLIAALLGGTLVYFGWTGQKSEPADSQPEEIKSEAIRQVMIPSSLDSEHVIVDLARYIHLFGETITPESSFWSDYFGIVHPNERFIEGTAAMWHGTVYLTKHGRKIDRTDDPLGFIVAFAVLKYQNPKFARKDYDTIIIKEEFKDFMLEGVQLKSKTGLAPVLESDIEQNPMIKLKSEQCQQYLLHSNNFVIYAFGLKQAAEDVMIRVIEQYTVK